MFDVQFYHKSLDETQYFTCWACRDPLGIDASLKRQMFAFRSMIYSKIGDHRGRFCDFISIVIASIGDMMPR